MQCIDMSYIQGLPVQFTNMMYAGITGIDWYICCVCGVFMISSIHTLEANVFKLFFLDRVLADRQHFKIVLLHMAIISYIFPPNLNS